MYYKCCGFIIMNKNSLNNLISLMERFPPSSHTLINFFLKRACLHFHLSVHAPRCLNARVALALWLMSAITYDHKRVCHKGFGCRWILGRSLPLISCFKSLRMLRDHDLPFSGCL